MLFDIFFSICQTEVNGVLPSERAMWRGFFDQVALADQLGFQTAWIAESHLSSQVQKRNPGAVIPHFKGEIGLNTDVLQLAHRIFSQTRRIHVGSAIRNILCNGGPMAHAEAVRLFLSLHGLDDGERRLLELGFASGRFPYSNQPYGIRPRNELERLAWPLLKGLIFQEATEIFLRFLKGEVFSSKDVRPKILRRERFRSDDEWRRVVEMWRQTLNATDSREPDAIEVPSQWVFDDVGVIPFAAPLELLRLTIGAHDPETQELANRILPVGVFNLSITPSAAIESTHERMRAIFHPSGGGWTRSHMPRTVLVFIDESRAVSLMERRRRAQDRALATLRTYWTAMEGTLDQQKVDQAVANALVGTAADIAAQIRERFHPEDRLMLWFDFNNHDNDDVKNSMRLFMERVAPDFIEIKP